MLVLLEGKDKTGKSTVADHYVKTKGYEYVHMTAPAKGITRHQYIASMFELIAKTVDKNVVLDRTWYGELVWPHAYGRTPLLYAHECEKLTDAAKMIHGGLVVKIYMHDDDEAAHKARLLKFKEPSFDYAFVKELYGHAMKAAGFQFLTFKEAEAMGWTK